MVGGGGREQRANTERWAGHEKEVVLCGEGLDMRKGGGCGVGVYHSCHAPFFFHPWTPPACTITLNKTGAMHVVSQNSMLAYILPKRYIIIHS